eukprot:5658899-Pleurochrysis_carterae.AAC.1
MNPRIYWLELYTETKKRIAKWKTLASLSIFGRARLVNSMMIYSRFKYPARQAVMKTWISKAVLIPKEILDYIEEDVHSLIWDRDPSLDEDKLGSSKHGKRYMKNDCQYNHKLRLGIGLLNFANHLRALQVNWILKYLDSSQAPWKSVLDKWLCRNTRDRGSVLQKIPTQELFKPLEGDNNS